MFSDFFIIFCTFTVKQEEGDENEGDDASNETKEEESVPAGTKGEGGGSEESSLTEAPPVSTVKKDSEIVVAETKGTDAEKFRMRNLLCQLFFQDLH